MLLCLGRVTLSWNTPPEGDAIDNRGTLPHCQIRKNRLETHMQVAMNALFG